MDKNDIYKSILVTLSLIVAVKEANIDSKNNVTNCERKDRQYIISCSDVGRKDYNDNFFEYLTPKFGAYISSTSDTMSVVVAPFFT